MRSIVAVAVAVAVAVVLGLGLGLAGAGSAAANDKALAPYAGKLVLCPDAPPPTLDELPAYLKANAVKDAHYDVIKGPPWKLHLVSVLAAPAKQVSLVIVDKADKSATPLLSAPFTLTHRKLLIAQSELTVAAGFAAGKTYVVRLVLGKKLLAKAELSIRE